MSTFLQVISIIKTIILVKIPRAYVSVYRDCRDMFEHVVFVLKSHATNTIGDPVPFTLGWKINHEQAYSYPRDSRISASY